MKINRLGAVLEPIEGNLALKGDHMQYRDTAGCLVLIPNSVILRLYEIARYEIQRLDQDWDLFVTKSLAEDLKHFGDSD